MTLLHYICYDCFEDACACGSKNYRIAAEVSDVFNEKFNDVDSLRTQAILMKKSINLTDLVPTQRYLFFHTMTAFMGNPFKYEAPFSYGMPWVKELPGGKYLIVDGHHRIAAEILKGNQVLDLFVDWIMP